MMICGTSRVTFAGADAPVASKKVARSDPDDFARYAAAEALAAIEKDIKPRWKFW